MEVDAPPSDPTLLADMAWGPCGRARRGKGAKEGGLLSLPARRKELAPAPLTRAETAAAASSAWTLRLRFGRPRSPRELRRGRSCRPTPKQAEVRAAPEKDAAGPDLTEEVAWERCCARGLRRRGTPQTASGKKGARATPSRPPPSEREERRLAWWGAPPWRVHRDGVDPAGRRAQALELCPPRLAPPAVLEFARGLASRRRIDLAGEVDWGRKESKRVRASIWHVRTLIQARRGPACLAPCRPQGELEIRAADAWSQLLRAAGRSCPLLHAGAAPRSSRPPPPRKSRGAPRPPLCRPLRPECELRRSLCPARELWWPEEVGDGAGNNELQRARRMEEQAEP
ncbi:unnamed protein product [Urochloa humidicola]